MEIMGALMGEIMEERIGMLVFYEVIDNEIYY